MNPVETAELLEIINNIRSGFGISVLLIEHDMALVSKNYNAFPFRKSFEV